VTNGRRRDVVIIDTHVLLWADVAPGRLSPTALATLEARERRVLVSAMSVFELAIKFHLGRLPVAGALLGDLDVTLARYGFEPLEFNTAHARRAATLALDHGDPFDRALVAQAIELGVGLVTADRALHAVPGLRTIW
jgi:PIN domain nuclease of toxin-antitoxin system